MMLSINNSREKAEGFKQADERQDIGLWRGRRACMLSNHAAIRFVGFIPASDFLSLGHLYTC